MKWTRRAIATLTVAAFSFSPISCHAQDYDGYDMGSGDGFYDEGIGFDKGFTTPSAAKLALGILASIVLIVIAISAADGESGDGTGGH